MGERRPSDAFEGDAVSSFMRDLGETPPPKSIGALKSATETFVKLRRSERQDSVRVRAYFLWVEHGRPEGRDLEFWTAANAEVGDDAVAASG